MKSSVTYSKLSTLCKVQNGYAFDSKLFTSDSNDMPLVRIRDIKTGQTETFYKGNYSQEYVLHNGDYIIGMDGEFNITEWQGGDALLNQRVCRIIVSSNKLLPKYVLYFLPIPLRKIEDETPFVTVKHLSSKKLNDIIIPVHSIEEQQRIVNELDLLTCIIDSKNAQLHDLDALSHSIFFEMFGNPVANEKGWLKKKLGDVCTIERGGSPRPIQDYITDAPDGINWIKIGDAVAGSKYISSTAEKIKPEGKKKSRFVHKGDFILSNSMSFGKPYILAVDGCIHDGWLVLRDDANSFDKNYLYYYLSSPDLYNEFKRLAVGGVVNNLNSGLVRGVSVSIPPKKLQDEFSEKESGVEAQRVLLRESIKEVQALFESRMNYFFAEV